MNFYAFTSLKICLFYRQDVEDRKNLALKGSNDVLPSFLRRRIEVDIKPRHFVGLGLVKGIFLADQALGFVWWRKLDSFACYGERLKFDMTE